MEKSPPNASAEEEPLPPYPSASITDHLYPRKVPDSKVTKKTCSKKRQNEALDAPKGANNGYDTSIEVASKQLVLYQGRATDPIPICKVSHNQAGFADPRVPNFPLHDLVPDSEVGCSPAGFTDPHVPNFPLRNRFTKVLPSIGAFTVQCAICLKWRIIPTQEKYEEIRANISEVPFICLTAKEWHPEISCDDPSDITPDGSRLWAIDQPDIARTPQGWQRLLRIRGEGSTRFADVYYISPSGKRLRSLVEIQKYLNDHPEYCCDGVSLSQFSFRIPKPMQENYTRKRTATSIDIMNRSGLGISRPIEPVEVNPLAWADPTSSGDLQIGGQHVDQRPRKMILKKNESI